MSPGSKKPVNGSIKTICKLCNRRAVNNTVQCEKCTTVMHRNCCEKKSLIFKDNRVICCDESTDLDDLFSSAKTVVDNMQMMKQEIIFLKELLDLKDKVISDKCSIIADKEVIIDLLKEEINYVKYANKYSDRVVNMSYSAPKAISSETTKADIATNSSAHDENIQQQKAKDKFSVSEVSKAIYKSQTAVKCDEYININNSTENAPSSITNKNESDGNTEKWSTVVYKSKKQGIKEKDRRAGSLKIVGKSSSSNLKAVPKFVDIHVYRLHPETRCEELTAYLRPNFPEVICTSLKPKHEGQYASFKISVYQQNFSKAMNAELWPEGTCISKFFHPRQSGKQWKI